jgi:hypothetical protein
VVGRGFRNANQVTVLRAADQHRRAPGEINRSPKG